MFGISCARDYIKLLIEGIVTLPKHNIISRNNIYIVNKLFFLLFVRAAPAAYGDSILRNIRKYSNKTWLN